MRRAGGQTCWGRGARAVGGREMRCSRCVGCVKLWSEYVEEGATAGHIKPPLQGVCCCSAGRHDCFGGVTLDRSKNQDPPHAWTACAAQSNHGGLGWGNCFVQHQAVVVCNPMLYASAAAVMLVLPACCAHQLQSTPNAPPPAHHSARPLQSPSVTLPSLAVSIRPPLVTLAGHWKDQPLPQAHWIVARRRPRRVPGCAMWCQSSLHGCVHVHVRQSGCIIITRAGRPKLVHVAAEYAATTREHLRSTAKW